MRRAAVLCASLAIAFAVYAAESDTFTPPQRNFWSLVPVKQQAVPAVKNQSWVKTPIDAFVLAKLEEKGLTPNPAADRLTLLRRATIDMTGLPPTQEEIQQFLSDKSPNAYEKVVDRLLASPSYGERWARHWQDVARYADSNGFKADETRPNIWRYRDYLIKAFNDDKPYDRFIKEQIAGDELYPGKTEALVAMGFNRHWIDESNSSTLFLRRQETLDDMTTVTAEAFLGLTFGCARCHNHKFDPILQKDYFRMQAFFANTGTGDGPLPIEDAVARKKYQEQETAWEEKTKDIRAEIATIEAPLRLEKMKTGSDYYQPEVKQAIFMDPAKRDPVQAMMNHTAIGLMAINAAFDAKALRNLNESDAKRYADLKKQLTEFDSIKPTPPAEGQFMVDISAHAPPTNILKGGNLDVKGDEVQPGFLSILDPSDAKITPLANSTGRRSALAAWLTDPKNPLVARVMVNRIWHYNFGSGIAATPGDFGRMGSRPTHPELLDYLATAFIDNGWSIKKINRMMLLSNTYQQSSEFTAKSAEADPDNKLMWRYGRHRMEAEAVRDSMLAVSGLLNTQMGGPGVFPPVPPGTISAKSSYGRWSSEKDEAQNNRRSVYIFVRRNLRYPMLEEFDSANTFESCDFRKNTVTPSQSLDLLNNGLILDWAQALAGRILNDTGLTPDAQVERAFKLTYGREPSAEEKKLASDFLAKQSAIMAQRLAGGEKVKPPLPTNLPPGVDPARAAALVDLSQTLMDSNEFLYVN
ncbi:MAG: DUF1549 and DUF1553 domain-containing protein [Acidobacteriota bacterium]